MTNAIQIIQNDMRNFFAAGFSIRLYGIDHALTALIFAGINPQSIPATPAYLVNAALQARAIEAGKQ